MPCANILKEHKYQVAQVTLDFEDYLWKWSLRAVRREERCRLHRSGSNPAIWPRRRSNIGLGRKMATLIYGRDIRHVLLRT